MTTNKNFRSADKVTLSESWTVWRATTESKGELKNFSQWQVPPQCQVTGQMSHYNTCTLGKQSVAKSNNNWRGLKQKQNQKNILEKKKTGKKRFLMEWVPLQ